MKGRGLVITGGMVLALLLWAAVQFFIGIGVRIFHPETFNFERTRNYFCITLGLAVLFYFINRMKKFLETD